VTLFDAYVAVDWSASSRPKRGADSIWFCAADGEAQNLPTRHEATTALRSVLRRAGAAGRRVLVGFDFPYGYPRGFADLVAPGEAPAWRRVWDLLSARIRDNERNANNRFDVAAGLNAPSSGPFWACPAGRACPGLTARRSVAFPHRGLDDLRLTERRTRGVQSAWKLAGAGSVGSQALLGIPRVASLRDDPELREVSAVWPFETGFAVPSAQIVHVEMWPSLVAAEAHAVKDAGQVGAVARHWQRLDRAGELAERFAPRGVPAAAEREEGWIFG
jgi:precorrin-8X/cobalt-precorrin-8 methylmutase